MRLLALTITGSPGEHRMSTMANQLRAAGIPYRMQLQPGGRRTQIIVSDRNHRRALAAIGAVEGK